MIPLLLPLLMCKIFSQASKNCLAVPFSIQLCRKKKQGNFQRVSFYLHSVTWDFTGRTQGQQSSARGAVTGITLPPCRGRRLGTSWRPVAPPATFSPARQSSRGGGREGATCLKTEQPSLTLHGLFSEPQKSRF